MGISLNYSIAPGLLGDKQLKLNSISIPSISQDSVLNTFNLNWCRYHENTNMAGPVCNTHIYGLGRSPIYILHSSIGHVMYEIYLNKAIIICDLRNITVI